MGVSGSGKTTVGRELAAALKGTFIDGDTLHPQSNISKMQRGEPLNDEDRRPWLDKISGILSDFNESGPLIVACSALKEAYRDRLRRSEFQLVYLKGSQELIERRCLDRKGHFMPPSLLASQFSALEEPADAITVDIDQPVEAIVQHVLTLVR